MRHDPTTGPDHAALDAGQEVARLKAPSRGWKHRLAAVVLRLGGWTPDGAPPDLPKYVIVAAPHTALSDGFWMLAFAWWWQLEVHWLVKQSWGRGPFGSLLRYAGAIPVDRESPQGLVGALVSRFRSDARLLVTIPPEGTRARREYWKSGFYHIALEAGVPVCLSYLDFARKKGGFGPCFCVTGDRRGDMDRIRDFYRDIRGKYPERFAEPRLREEDGEA